MIGADHAGVSLVQEMRRKRSGEESLQPLGFVDPDPSRVGQPVINPLYNSSCPIGAGCQPYLNPSAFMRPSFGQLGNAPRTLDGARGPWNRYFNASASYSTLPINPA